MAKQPYAEHHASVTVNATPHQVYSMFSHFNDFPKFMSFVKEVTYQDDQHSHWVAEVVGKHEWNAVNENWQQDRQIGWKADEGLKNFGRVTFTQTNPEQTQVNVYIAYDPPAGVLGEVGEKLGAGSHFEKALQNDLDHFARMVDQAPAGSLDPNTSNYLFHSESAASKGKTTDRQNQTMYNDTRTENSHPNSSKPMMDKDITGRSSNSLSSTQPNTGTRTGNQTESTSIDPSAPKRDGDTYGY